ncbi:MAG: hypothetical protein ACK41U_06710 [Paracoccus sp. (in: a-proteobacteria)]|uniref:hypothetical protein n=1 Tax=Paracoccus sp. TaxID=267 RepID=UPI00391A5CF6
MDISLPKKLRPCDKSISRHTPRKKLILASLGLSLSPLHLALASPEAEKSTRAALDGIISFPSEEYQYYRINNSDDPRKVRVNAFAELKDGKVLVEFCGNEGSAEVDFSTLILADSDCNNRTTGPFTLANAENRAILSVGSHVLTSNGVLIGEISAVGSEFPYAVQVELMPEFDNGSTIVKPLSDFAIIQKPTGEFNAVTTYEMPFLQDAPS